VIFSAIDFANVAVAQLAAVSQAERGYVGDKCGMHTGSPGFTSTEPIRIDHA
jgi:hypothetical protein